MLKKIIDKIDLFLQDYCDVVPNPNTYKIKRVRWSSIVKCGFTYSKQYYDRSCFMVDTRLFCLPKHVLESGDYDYDDIDFEYKILKRCKPVHQLLEDKEETEEEEKKNVSERNEFVW